MIPLSTALEDHGTYVSDAEADRAAELTERLHRHPDYPALEAAEEKALRAYRAVEERHRLAAPPDFREERRALLGAARALDGHVNGLPPLPPAMVCARIRESAPLPVKAALDALVAQHAIAELRAWCDAEADRVNAPRPNPLADELAEAGRQVDRARAAIATLRRSLA